MDATMSQKDNQRAQGWVPVPDVARALGLNAATVLRWTDVHVEASEHKPVATATVLRSRLVNGTRRYVWLGDVVTRIGRDEAIRRRLIAKDERVRKDPPT